MGWLDVQSAAGNRKCLSKRLYFWRKVWNFVGFIIGLSKNSGFMINMARSIIWWENFKKLTASMRNSSMPYYSQKTLLREHCLNRESRSYTKIMMGEFPKRSIRSFCQVYRSLFSAPRNSHHFLPHRKLFDQALISAQNISVRFLK